MTETQYASPFNLKEEKNKIKERAKQIQDPKERKAMLEKETRDLDNHAEMLRKMSKFVNSKNKNGMR
jgi:hypothetical protein